MIRFRYLSCVMLALLTIGSACKSLPPGAYQTPTPVSESSLQPYIDIRPETSLADEVISIRVGGINPGQEVTLKTFLEDDLDQQWQAQATFLANENGVVDVSAQAPISGSYQVVDPMGLFWSMSSEEADNPFLSGNYGTAVVSVTFVAEIDQELVAMMTINRIRLTENVESLSLNEEGLVGQFYFPQGEGPFPAILVLGGSGGGVSPGIAIMLASHGYATLALAYFGEPPLPAQLSEIPLEYFGMAIEWLKAQEMVAENKIGVLGGSRGGELALLVAATYPDLKAVIGYVPSGVVLRNNPSAPIGEKSAWTYAGTPVPFTNNFGAASLAKAAIPVENINGPILLISGKDDQVWPSTMLTEIAVRRLEENRHPYPYEHLTYRDAGHLIGLPYWPTTISNGVHPVTGEELIFGGTARGNADASADAWAHLLLFLEVNLKHSE